MKILDKVKLLAYFLILIFILSLINVFLIFKDNQSKTFVKIFSVIILIIFSFITYKIYKVYKEYQLVKNKIDDITTFLKDSLFKHLIEIVKNRKK